MSLSDAKCNAANKGLQVVCTSAAQLGEHMRWSLRPSDRDQFCNRVSFLAVLSCPRMVWQGSVPSGKSSSSSQQQQQQNSNTEYGRTDGRPDRKLIRVQGGSSNDVRETPHYLSSGIGCSDSLSPSLINISSSSSRANIHSLGNAVQSRVVVLRRRTVFPMK